MKTKHLKFSMTGCLCIFSLWLSAQTVSKPGLYEIDHHIYVVAEFGKGDNVLVEEREDSGLIARARQYPRTLTKIEYVHYSGEETTDSAFVKVLGAQRIKELIPEKYVILYLYFDAEGRILSIEYVLNKNSALKLQEIDKLTSFIEKNVSFKIPSYVDKDAEFWPFMQAIKFDALVN